MAPRIVVKLPATSPNSQKTSSTSKGRKTRLSVKAAPKSPEQKPNASNPSSNRVSKAKSSTSNKRCRFLQDLPGEIRNRIYDLVILPFFVAKRPFHLWKPRDKRQPTPFKVAHPVLGAFRCKERDQHGVPWDPSDGLHLAFGLRHYSCGVGRDARNGHYICIPDDQRQNHNVALLAVCRQIHSEVVSIIYSRVTFVFTDPQAIRSKLLPAYHKKRLCVDPKSTHIRSSNLTHITSLCLACLPYGAPRETKDIAWQRRYYQAWTTVCGKVVEQLPNLTKLQLIITVPTEAPLRLVLSDKWVTPFLQFSRCKKLTDAVVDLNHCSSRIDYRLLHVFAEVMRRKIMGWDDASALEVINFARRSNLLDREGTNLEGNLEFMERTNKEEYETTADS